MFRITYFLILAFAWLSSLGVSYAATTGYCPEYFNDKHNIRLSMDDAASGVVNDMPVNHISGVNSLSYSSGKLSFTTTNTAAILTLLQYTTIGSIPVGTRYGQGKEIASAVYQNFTVRMYSSVAGIGQIRWFHAHDRWAFTAFNVLAGWNTYQIDLGSASITLSSGSNVAYTDANPQGLEFLPVNVSGASVMIDWIQLTDASCSSYDFTYNTGGNRTSVVLDDNSDFTDGSLYQTASQTSNSFSIPREYLTPASYNLYAITSNDFATQNLANPYDMSGSDDISSSSGISGLSFSGGEMTGTSSNADPNFYLKIPSSKSISAAVYSFVSAKITLSGLASSSTFQLFFYQAGTGAFLGSRSVAVNNGANLLQFQLTAGDGWSGNIGTVRVDPVAASGVSISIDFIAIQSSGYVATLSSPTPVAIDTLTVPELNLAVLRPDKKGGRDFAQSVKGKAWNMGSVDDFERVSGVESALIYPFSTLADQEGTNHDGNFFFAQNQTGNGDPNYYLIYRNAALGILDTSTFVNICFRGWNSTEVSGHNSVARIIWLNPVQFLANGTGGINGDDIILARGSREYCLDMRSTVDAQTEPAWSGSDPNPWTSIKDNGYNLNFLRLDMNENQEAGYYSVIDSVQVRADHEANSQYAIVVDADTSNNIALFYNTTASTSGGVAITTLTAGRNSNTYIWDTSGLSNGTYYVYASVTSNGNTLTRLGEGRVVVSHSLTQDSTNPILSCERPFDGYDSDDSVELAGYALDETRLASVEVFFSTDNSTYTYQGSLTPSMFHYDASQAYSTYAEANNPGWHENFSLGSIPYGTYYVRLIATDTAGNQTSCTKTVLRSVGGSTSPLTYPTPNATPVSVPITSGSGTPRLSVRASTSTLTFTLTNATSCTVYGQTSAALLSSAPVTIGSTTTGRGKSLKVPAVKGGVGKQYLFFKANCGGTSTSNSKLDSSKIKNTKKAKLASVLQKVRTAFREF